MIKLILGHDTIVIPGEKDGDISSELEFLLNSTSYLDNRALPAEEAEDCEFVYIDRGLGICGPIWNAEEMTKKEVVNFIEKNMKKNNVKFTELFDEADIIGTAETCFSFPEKNLFDILTQDEQNIFLTLFKKEADVKC